MITLENTMRDKGKITCTIRPKVLIAREILSMSRGNVAKLFKETGILNIDGVRMQWLVWLDQQTIGFSSLSHAAWAFEEALHHDRGDALLEARSCAVKHL